jgi:hypothetical protein
MKEYDVALLCIRTRSGRDAFIPLIPHFIQLHSLLLQLYNVDPK